MKINLPILPIIALLVANALPLVGVFFFGWDAGMVIVAYWFENLVIGFYAIGRIILASQVNSVRKPPSAWDVRSMHLTKIFLVPFFLLHFGGFCAVHGSFILGMTGSISDEKDRILADIMSEGGLTMLPRALHILLSDLFSAAPSGLIILVLGLLISHGVSFVSNYILRGEFRETTVDAQMFAPYGRIVVIHVAIIAAGFFIIRSGSPLPLVLTLVAGKTILDLVMHVYSHQKKSLTEVFSEDAGV